MASEIRVNKLNSQTGVGTITLSPTGVDISGITTAETLKATTGIVTTLTATTGIVTTLTANTTKITTGIVTTLTATTGIVTTLTTNTLTANSTAKVGSGVTLSPDGDVFVTGVTTSSTVKVGAAVTISESGIEASGIGITIANINGSQIGGRRNLIINGAMQVAQRGTSSTSEGYVIDRMNFLYNDTDEAPTYSQQSISSSDTGPYEAGFTKYLRIQNGNQTSGGGAADYILFRQSLEAQNIANSGWRSQSPTSFMTLSFWVKSSVAQTFYGNIMSLDGTQRNFPFSLGSLSANTWTKVIQRIPGNTSPTVDIDNDNGTGLNIDIWPYAGANYTDSGTTVDTWTTFVGGTRLPVSTATWYTTNDATFDVTGMQLEVGSQATAFEHRSYGEELELCKRYCQLLTRGDNDHYFGMGYYYNSTNIYLPIRFAPQMRATPSIVQNTGSGFYNFYRDGAGDGFDGFDGFSWNSGAANAGVSGSLYVNTGTSGTGGTAGAFFASNDSCKVLLSAEL
jgi:hypothetical protein